MLNLPLLCFLATYKYAVTLFAKLIIHHSRARAVLEYSNILPLFYNVFSLSKKYLYNLNLSYRKRVRRERMEKGKGTIQEEKIRKREFTAKGN